MKKIFLLFSLLTYLDAEFFYDIQRRRNQYLDDPGYLIAAAPFAIPGIGKGIAFLGMMNNIYDSQADLMLTKISGDVDAYAFAVTDLYLVKKHLKFELLQNYLNEASLQSFSSRGMDSDKDDYLHILVGESEFTAMRTTASFYEKMLELYFTTYFNKFSIQSLYDRDGTQIIASSGGQAVDSRSYIFGLMLDYTDDRLDPREGIRFDSSVDYAPQDNLGSADFYVTNYNTTLYLPLGLQSTWVFNFYRSDAHIITQGTLDYTQVSQDLGLDCTSIADLTQRSRCESTINNTIAANQYGTATSLGGRSRLRSYPEGRFKGAHTQFYGTEFRWNLTDERTPFDMTFMKDIRTGVQIAFFYERGSISELISDLGKNERESYGLGLRMVTASGLVYRFDVAKGDEGSQITLMINYPWEIF